jgi:hypothetical protein
MNRQERLRFWEAAIETSDVHHRQDSLGHGSHSGRLAMAKNGHVLQQVWNADVGFGDRG